VSTPTAPLYARALRLRQLRPTGLVCFLLFEGVIGLSILLALAEFVSWWGILALPAAVAVMVKINDVVLGLTRAGRPGRTADGPPVPAPEPADARSEDARSAGAAGTPAAVVPGAGTPPVQPWPAGPPPGPAGAAPKPPPSWPPGPPQPAGSGPSGDGAPPRPAVTVRRTSGAAPPMSGAAPIHSPPGAGTGVPGGATVPGVVPAPAGLTAPPRRPDVPWTAGPPRDHWTDGSAVAGVPAGPVQRPGPESPCEPPTGVDHHGVTAPVAGGPVPGPPSPPPWPAAQMAGGPAVPVAGERLGPDAVGPPVVARGRARVPAPPARGVVPMAEVLRIPPAVPAAGPVPDGPSSAGHLPDQPRPAPAARLVDAQRTGEWAPPSEREVPAARRRSVAASGLPQPDPDLRYGVGADLPASQPDEPAGTATMGDERLPRRTNGGFNERRFDPAAPR